MEELLKERDKFIRELESERDGLSKLIGELKRQRDKYKGMIFKANLNQPFSDSGNPRKKKLGGQLNHTGDSRRLPQKIDQIKRVFLHHCLSDSKII